MGEAPDWDLIACKVPVIREALLRCGDWAAVAARQKRDFFGAQSRALARSRVDSLVEAFELMCAMQPGAAGVEVGTLECTEQRGRATKHHCWALLQLATQMLSWDAFCLYQGRSSSLGWILG